MGDFTKLRNGLYMDNKTKTVGYLKPNPATGGWYVSNMTKLTKEQIGNLKDKKSFVLYGEEEMEALGALHDFKKARAKAERDRKYLKQAKDIGQGKSRYSYYSNEAEYYRKNIDRYIEDYNKSKAEKKLKEEKWRKAVEKANKSIYGQINILDARDYK